MPRKKAVPKKGKKKAASKKAGVKKAIVSSRAIRTRGEKSTGGASAGGARTWRVFIALDKEENLLVAFFHDRKKLEEALGRDGFEIRWASPQVGGYREMEGHFRVIQAMSDENKLLFAKEGRKRGRREMKLALRGLVSRVSTLGSGVGENVADDFGSSRLREYFLEGDSEDDNGE